MNYNDYNRPDQDRSSIETDEYQVDGVYMGKKKKQSSGMKVVAACLVCALIGGAVGGGGAMYAASQNSLGTAPVIQEGDRATTAMGVANVESGTLLSAEEVYAVNLESVVGISGDAVSTNVWEQSVRNAVSGSGFVIRSDGYILTNYHVVDGVSDIKVSFSDGSVYDATVVGGEEQNDIAVLKVEATGLPAVTLGDSDALLVGETVLAIGNPLGELTFSLTGGYVSAKDRSITMSDGTVMNMLQTTAAINSGNSGGPLFDCYGQVIGIVTAKYSSNTSSSSTSVEGIGFAIPINDVKDMVSDIIEYGYVQGKPNVGIIMQNVSSYALQYGVPSGAYISAVLSGSCADQAGLEAGDIVIGVDDTEIESVDQLKAAIANHESGDTVTFTVYRNGQTVTMGITLDENDQQRRTDMDALYEEYEQQQQRQSQQSQGGNGWPGF